MEDFTFSVTLVQSLDFSILFFFKLRELDQFSVDDLEHG